MGILSVIAEDGFLTLVINGEENWKKIDELEETHQPKTVAEWCDVLKKASESLDDLQNPVLESEGERMGVRMTQDSKAVEFENKKGLFKRACIYWDVAKRCFSKFAC